MLRTVTLINVIHAVEVIVVIASIKIHVVAQNNKECDKFKSPSPAVEALHSDSPHIQFY